MFEQAFKSIDDILWKEAGCTTELDYTPSRPPGCCFSSISKIWRRTGRPRRSWRAARTPEFWPRSTGGGTGRPRRPRGGKLDHNKAMTGDDLREFVDNELFPDLQGFKQRASGPDTIEYEIGEILSGGRGRLPSPGSHRSGRARRRIRLLGITGSLTDSTRSAIRRCFVKTVRDLDLSPIFPSFGSMFPVLPFLGRVPWGDLR